MRLKMASPVLSETQTPVGVKPYKAVRGYLRRADAGRAKILAVQRNAGIMGTPFTAFWLGNYPEWLAGQSLLDIALNREWPKHDNS